MLIVQKHLQAVTKALLDKEVASIGELLDKIEQLKTENDSFRKFIKNVSEQDSGGGPMGDGECELCYGYLQDSAKKTLQDLCD